MSLSNPGFLRMFCVLGCVHLQGWPGLQQRPPQSPLLHSAALEHRTPGAFFAMQLPAEQYALEPQSVGAAQLVLHVALVASHRKLPHGEVVALPQVPLPSQVRCDDLVALPEGHD